MQYQPIGEEYATPQQSGGSGYFIYDTPQVAAQPSQDQHKSHQFEDLYFDAPQHQPEFQPQYPPPQQNQDLAVTVPFEDPKKKHKHPIACFFHAFFKFAAIILFWILNFISSVDFVTIFIVTVLLVTFDFWTVKNVTGRLLVGLRWWNEIKDDGSNEWIFESLEGQRAINSFEAILFWGLNILAPLLWIGTAIFKIFKPTDWEDFLIFAIALILSCCNIYCYIRCSREAKKRATTAAQKVALQVGTAAALNATNTYLANQQKQN